MTGFSAPTGSEAAHRRVGHRSGVPARRARCWCGRTRPTTAPTSSPACRRAGARFSITARLNPAVVKAITGIDEQAWTPIRYPNAIFDEDEQRWVSDAEVAETVLTAFTGRRKSEHVTARLIVRRVRRLNPRAAVPAGQTELFAVYRYHAVFTDRAEPMLAAEATHRDHAIVEQVIAELKNGPLAHLPSGRVHRQRRLAGLRRDRAQPHPRRRRPRRPPATPAPAPRTIRAQLIHTPARLAHSAHQQLLHLPRLALGGRAGRAVPPRPARPPTRSTPDHRPAGARPEITSGRAGQTGSTTTPSQTHQPARDQLPPLARSTVDPGSAPCFHRQRSVFSAWIFTKADSDQRIRQGGRQGPLLCPALRWQSSGWRQWSGPWGGSSSSRSGGDGPVLVPAEPGDQGGRPPTSADARSILLVSPVGCRRRGLDLARIWHAAPSREGYRPPRLSSSRCASNHAMTSPRFHRLCLPIL